MARIARVVIPGVPHHVVQRGNRGLDTFFHQQDYEEYLALMAEWCGRRGVRVWAYCLMPNHVHLIAVPATEDALRRGIGEAHRRYTRMINEREGWKGHLWQGRFASFPVDEQWLLAAARYVECDPVMAGLVQRPEDYPWSSAAAHLRGEDDVLVKVAPLLERVSDWQQLLATGVSVQELEELRRHERTGRPLGDDDFITHLENITKRVLHRQKPGPKKKDG